MIMWWWWIGDNDDDVPPNVIITASLNVVTPNATASSIGSCFAP